MVHRADDSRRLFYRVFELVGGISFLFGLYLTSLYRYVLFHSLVEMFSIVVACGVFMVYWNSRRFLENGYFLFVGIAYLCVGLLDMLHTLAYKGMGVFPSDGGNVANQLWIAARYFESLSFVGGCLFLHRRIKVPVVVAGYATAVVLTLCSVFLWRIFPDCFIDGVGVTRFKTINEFILCGILAAALFLLARNRTSFDPTVLRWLMGSISLTIASELSFSYYTDPYGAANLTGHLFKLVSFYLLYRAFIEEGLKRPYDLIFRELRRHEEQLANFSAIVNSSHDAIITVTRTGAIATWNPAAERLLGYAAEEMIGQDISLIWPPNPSHEVRSLWDKIERGETVEQVETVRRRKDGSFVDLSTTLFPVKDRTGRITGISGIHRDITERKQAERTLRESEKRYRTLVESIGLGIVLIDKECRITAMNGAIARMIGRPADACIGQECFRVFEQRDSVCPNCPCMHATQAKRPVDVEKTAVRNNGTTYSVRVQAFPLYSLDGAANGFIEVVEDISERKRMEEELSTAREQYRIVAENVDDVIWTADMNLRWTYISPSIERFRGYTAAETQDQTIDAILAPASAALVKDALGNFLTDLAAGNRNQDGHARLEVEYRCKDGSTKWAEVNVSAVRSPEGTPTSLVGVTRDISGRKEAEQELIKARQEAEAANLSKSEFLANMSHEIRTPMTAILGFADILAESALAENVESVEIIKRNGKHLLSIINDILDLSKIEAGRCVADLQPCSPSQMAADVLALMKVRADAKGLALTLDCQGEMPSAIRTDPIRLRQILVNLIGNAIKFTEVGGVRVVVSTEPAGNNERMLRVDVIDTGIGISEKGAAALFQPFSQVDASTHRRFGGTGLGLTISKRLAKMLGGDIAVTSVLGKGSVFSLTVAATPLDGVEPTVPTVKMVASDAKAAPLLPRLDGRILLAEDGPDNQRLIVHILRKAGAEVTVADNGQSAVDLALAAAADEDAFDVILMDIQMPIIDGYEATHRLRNAGYARPIIALTAHAMKQDQQNCMNAGCDDYLTKPIDRAALLNLVAKHLHGKERPKANLLGR